MKKSWKKMDRNLTVMEEAVERGLKGVQSVTGLTGGDAVLLKNLYSKWKIFYLDNLILDAVSKAVATNEVNAAMGTILYITYCWICWGSARNAVCSAKI